MSLLTIIDQVPLYTTIEEALIWGTQYNITGYHTHVYNGVTGYMPGQNHEQITNALAGGIINFLTPQQLAQGQFVVTPAAAQAYMNQQNVSIPTTTQQPAVQFTVQQPTEPDTSTPTITTKTQSKTQQASRTAPVTRY